MVLALCALSVRLARLYGEIRATPANAFEDFNFYLYAFTTVLHRPGDASLLYDQPSLLAFLQAIGVTKGGTSIFYTYPPQFALLFSPFGHLPPLVAKLVWVSCSVLLFAIGLALLVKVAYRGKDSGVRLLLVAIALATYPLMIDILLGQSNQLLFFLVVGALFFLDRGNRYIAGIFLGTAIVLKVTPIVIGGLLLMRREWRTAVATAATSLVITILTAWKLGFYAIWHYVVADMPRLAASNLGLDSAPDNNSLRGAVNALARMAGKTVSESTLHAIWFVTAVVVCLLAIALVFRRHTDRRIDFALAVMTMLVASPVLEPVHLVAALIPLTILLGTAFERPGVRLSMFPPRVELVLISLVVLTMFAGPRHITYVVASLIVYALCLARYARPVAAWRNDLAPGRIG
ncbi:Polyprenol-phosphate-mannose-dependent alpha-(1-2)-phosphatidylinositol mannoside mannosyltransferase [Caballeronia choica]|uniref:Polyprenol-phosphate-mannose-dependent alpha-(1-2)-phosphatidylinositol mannoside mannosyltransferase n=1 Tax=Caballeronia choica TaxID=326476 RepID=A0A158KR04_9BURK|nr:glycosyltransferase family 87 protein [Caballeronia choica]SAL83020.1 Polyprenol-phosphate-mannose-dependent alpha-(1-2)-phosphatidylinositol mannoside mannosyltransferase [Caballeronia choica]